MDGRFRLFFLTLLLLEKVQLIWFSGRVPEDKLVVALKANPAVEWYLRQKCPQLNGWLDHVPANAPIPTDPDAIRQAEIEVLASKTDLLVYAVDGLITEIPFPDSFFNITMGGHVFGDFPEAEYWELLRVTRLGGSIILCPGNSDQDNERHAFLVAQGFEWARFEEPSDGWKRKYWKTCV